MSSLKQNGFNPVGTIRSNTINVPPSITGDCVCVGEIGPTTQWSEALLDADIVIHLAARVHVLKENAADPLAIYRSVNVDGTSRLAEQAIESGVTRFIYVSSIKVNGEITTDSPYTEDSMPAPVDPYGQSKLEAEMLLQELIRSSDMELVIVRPPLVYGPGVGGNFKRLIDLVKSGFPLPLGSVHNARSMVSLQNLTDFLITCLEHPRAAGQTFLVSDGEDWSTPDLINAIARALGVSKRLFPVPLPLLQTMGRLMGQEQSIQRLCQSLAVDISKSRDCLGWEPQQSSEDAIRQTVEAYLSLEHA
jgi:UDP-glucose 4-epimerase